MENFILKITDYNIDLINNFRAKFNHEDFKYKLFYHDYRYIKYGITSSNIEPQLTGENDIKNKELEITDEDFLKFYNEKMGNNQLIIYELW